MRVPVSIVGASYLADSSAWDAQRTINFYPRVSESGNAKSATALLACPGLDEYVTLPEYPVRGMRVAGGRLFVVAGYGLYEVTGAGAYTLRGTISNGRGYVGMTDDGDELVIGDGEFWVFNLKTNALALIDGAPAGTQCDVINSVLLCLEADTGRLWYGEPTAAATIDGLNFVTAEAKPDNAVAIKVDHGEIMVLGESTIEIWAYTGGSDNAVERVSNAVIEQGCAAPWSVEKIDNSVFWLGKNELGEGVIWRATGMSPQRISTHAVEYWLSQSSDVSQAKAWTYQDSGHSFYAITAPGLSTTWVYDVATQQWHERAYLNGGNERHRADFHVYWNGLHLVGDYETGIIYRMSRDLHDDNGQAMKCTRVTGYSSGQGERLFFSRLWVDMETGVGLDGTGQGMDPVAWLRWSDDGGKTWSAEHQASIGRIGAYQVRAVWNRLGSSRARLFEFGVSDPVRLTVMQAYADVEAGQA